jgi:hypothetical protein
MQGFLDHEGSTDRCDRPACRQGRIDDALLEQLMAYAKSVPEQNGVPEKLRKIS